MIVALYGNMDRKETLYVAQQINEFLTKRNIKVVAKEAEGIAPLSSVPFEKINFLISLGGDGTILRLVHTFDDLKIPIIGINLGHLGFMADIPLSHMNENLEDLLEGNYTIEKRVVIDAEINDSKCFAVNDIVIHRAKNPSLIDLSIKVDGSYLNTFSADGIIISTANGSTAYSLSSGGPILTPELEAFVITPICPHTISNRPIVLMPKDKIEIEYISPYQPVEIIADGFTFGHMMTKEIFTLSKSNKTFKMVNLSRTDYFATLREKLGWAGQVRYNVLNNPEWHESSGF